MVKKQVLYSYFRYFFIHFCMISHHNNAKIRYYVEKYQHQVFFGFLINFYYFCKEYGLQHDEI